MILALLACDGEKPEGDTRSDGGDTDVVETTDGGLIGDIYFDDADEIASSTWAGFADRVRVLPADVTSDAPRLVVATSNSWSDPEGGQDYDHSLSVLGSPLPEDARDADHISLDGSDVLFDVGDVDGDGAWDVLTADWSDDRLEIWHLPFEHAGAVYVGDAMHDGWVVGGVEDVTGDGYADLLVGDSRFDETGPDTYRGRVYLKEGPLAMEDDLGDNAIEGEEEGDRLGGGVTPVGDLDGDGMLDVAISAWGWERSGLDLPATYLCDRECWAFGTVALAWAVVADDIRVTGGGLPVRAGDLDGDGRENLCMDDIGMDDRAGLVACFADAPAGETLLSSTSVRVETAYAIPEAASAGDMDGDDRAELLVKDGYDRPSVYLLTGAIEGTIDLQDGAVARFRANSDYDDYSFDWALAGPVDWDGDGFGDVALGLEGWRRDTYVEGQVGIFYGGAP